MSDATQKRRRWFQFRLRTLLIAIVVLSLPLSWVGVIIQRARNQMKAVRAIQTVGGEVRYNYRRAYVSSNEWDSLSSCAAPPQWMRALVGNEFSVAVCNCCYGLDANWVELEEINDKQMLCLLKCSTLEYLCIRDSQVTDRGLERLRELRNLKLLVLYGTQVTPEGVKRLQEALPNCQINY